MQSGIKVFSILAVAVTLISCAGGATSPTEFAPTQAFASPTPLPPVATLAPSPTPSNSFTSKDTATFTVAQPTDAVDLDPTTAVDPASIEIIQNTYETLIFYRRDSVTDFVPQLAEQVPSLENGGISADGRTYTFKIRSGVKFHSGAALTPADVAYTFQRNLLIGSLGAPQALLFEAVLGATLNNDVTDLINPTGILLDNPQKLAGVDPAVLQNVCTRVQNAVSADAAAGRVTFKLAHPWGPFLAITAAYFSSIQNRQWAANNGGWDGDCADWQKYYAQTADQVSQTKLGRSENGSGPYALSQWTPGKSIVLKAAGDYWRTSPAWDGGPSGAPALKTIDIQISKAFSPRLAALKSGAADTLGFFSVPLPNQVDALTGQVCDLNGSCALTQTGANALRAYTDLPASPRLDAFFNFDIDNYQGNSLLGSGRLDGSGIPVNFFTDVHIRRAFSYCFDWQAYIQQALAGQGVQAAQVMLPGELGASSGASSAYYSFDAQKCAQEFKASVWRSADGKNLWDTGFQMGLMNNPTNPASQVFDQILSKNVAAVNPKFVIQVSNPLWEDYRNALHDKRLPITLATSREVVPDAHYWVFQFTAGGLANGISQMPPGMKDQFASLVSRAVAATSPAVREQLYQQFDQLYFENAPAILLAIGQERRYEQRWVKGYYFNPMLADLYFYALSKE
jgi:peptide/nickel transport system substrate-binding protein